MAKTPVKKAVPGKKITKKIPVSKSLTPFQKPYQKVMRKYQSETDIQIKNVKDGTISNVVADIDEAIGSFASFMDWLPNPDLVLRKAGVEIIAYKEFLTDAFVKGVFESRKSGVMSKEWDIDRGQAKSRQTKAIIDIFNNLDVYQILNNMLDAVYYGYQIFEYTWFKTETMIVPIDIVAKPAEWFRFDKYANILFRSQNNPEGVKVPDNKFLAVKNEDSYANPYGNARAALIYWPATFKKGGLKFWVKFTEKFGMPWIKGKYNANALSTEDVENFLDDLNEMVQDAVIVQPDTYELDMTTPQRQSADIYNQLLAFMKAEISIAFLGHTGIAQETPGKLGNETAAIEVRGDIIASDKRMIEQAMNQIIKLIYDLNFGKTKDYPKFVLYEEEDVDKDLAERDQILTNTGIKLSKEYYKKAYGLEDEDFELKVDEPAPGFDGPQEFQKETKDQDVIDKQADKAPEMLNPAMERFLKPIEGFLDKQANFEDAIKNMSKLYPKLNTDEIQDLLADKMFVADVIGRLSDADEKKLLEI